MCYDYLYFLYNNTFDRGKNNRRMYKMMTLVDLDNVRQTAAEMRRLVETYAGDIGALANIPFIFFYKLICALPYANDPRGVETVSRPALLLDPGYSPRDCDDKSILLAAWCRCNGIKCRFVASSTRKNCKLHHVFLQLENGILVDATYKRFGKTPFYYDYFKKSAKFSHF